ncbi:Cph1 family holin [Orenia metallireducens]|uniref:Holin, Cph1 family n=1 Tax=Orenia metallireducens TaxID=1413210 RepID=A0A285IF87_9FIRM|nr:phage holin family protein [Orenia metallireducens]PRX18482.1 Cph1 family holin [Orenia metallireducens]SNY46658.1 holin, Cph1 family [Orenia metallireducens]
MIVFERLLNYFHYLVGLIGGFIYYGVGGYDKGLEVLMWMVVIDYITGLLSAYVLKELDSDIGREGIARKVGLFFTVAIAHLVDQVLGSEGMVRQMAIWFYISKEGISALENLGEAGVPIPEFLRKALKQLRDKE